MANRVTPGHAGAAYNGQIEPVDPKSPHELQVAILCASEYAAYDVMMNLASKMRLACHGLDDTGPDRSLPAAGTEIRLVTREGRRDVGTAVVVPTPPADSEPDEDQG